MPAPSPQDADEQAYRALEHTLFTTRQPHHAVLHAEWVRAKERYDVLRAEYLELLERWPGWQTKVDMIERLLESTRDWVKQLTPYGRRYEAHLKRIEAGLVDPSACQLCHAAVLGRQHPKYAHIGVGPGTAVSYAEEGGKGMLGAKEEA